MINSNFTDSITEIHLISLFKFNLPLLGTFTWPTPPGSYIATTCRERELNCGSHTYFFWPHKDMAGFPGWAISPMPGPPPRQHKHDRRYTPSTHPVIPTRRIWNDDYDGQMILGDPGGPKVSWHLSDRWGKTPKKTSPRKRVPTGDRTRARCVTSAHATTCSTAVDQLQKLIVIITQMKKDGAMTSSRSRQLDDCVVYLLKGTHKWNFTEILQKFVFFLP